MADSYCTRADLHKHGLPRGALAEQARQICSVDVSGNLLELADHGFADDDKVQFAIDGGSTLPAPLAVGTSYYVITVADRSGYFQVAATAGGSAIDLTDDGDGTFGVVLVDNSGRIDSAIEYASREIDNYLIAHGAPFEAPYPRQVVAWTAKLAAQELLRSLGREVKLVTDSAQDVRRDLVRRANSGIPLRDAAVTTSPSNLSRCLGVEDRGWRRSDGSVP